MIIAIIQARTGSTRLPGKVFKNILGKSMLWHMLNRLRYCEALDNVVLAIPDSIQNDVLETFANENGISLFRGNEEDVLSRYYGAAKQYNADIVVRLTSDCPLIDPALIDSAIVEHIKAGAEYTSKGSSGGFPRGLESEVFDIYTLERAFKEASQYYEREHVTPYIYQHPEFFKVNIVRATGKLARPELRLTVDTKEDFILITEIFKSLYIQGRVFDSYEIIDFLDKHPELININNNIRQKDLLS